MFDVDAKPSVRLRRGLERVVVFDPQPAAGRVAAELLKTLGARHVVCSADAGAGLELIAEFDPGLVCTELHGPGFDGLELTLRLRRSALPAREAPVVVISGEATVERITAARDAGASEFLRKPFTGRDMLRRVESAFARPRGWVESPPYVGPDRRRFHAAPGAATPGRRASDRPAEASPPEAAAAG